MRILLFVPLLLTAACNVQTDSGNNQVTLQYNAQAAQDAASDVGNTAQGIGQAIGNDVHRAGDQIDNSSIVAKDGQNDGNDNGNAATNATGNRQ